LKPIRDEVDQAKWNRILSWGKKKGVRKSFLEATYNSYYNRRYSDERGMKTGIADRLKTEAQFGIKRGDPKK